LITGSAGSADGGNKIDSIDRWSQRVMAMLSL
jgi:hypothetical protein